MINDNPGFTSLLIKFHVLDLRLGLIMCAVGNLLRARRESIKEVKPVVIAVEYDKLRLISE
ncbi:hypothetical protein D3C86_1065140 [compost metagenome]